MDFAYELEILVHVAIASFLAALIGYQREIYNKPAGIKTNMIVGGAVALLVSMGEAITLHFQEIGLAEYIQTDPTRILQAIVVGVSFIGAGTVLQSPSDYKVKYLTTAATILFSTGLGICIALEFYLLAVGLTAFVLIFYYLIKLMEKKIFKHKK